jgi:hypothetical protein
MAFGSCQLTTQKTQGLRYKDQAFALDAENNNLKLQLESLQAEVRCPL